MRADPRSLRFRALFVVVAVVVLPLAWVWASGMFESTSVLALRQTLHDAVGEAARTWADSGDLVGVAERHRVRLRVVDADGAVVLDVDQADGARWFEPVADPFYGPGGAPDLGTVDAELPPLLEREEVREANGGPAARCTVAEQGLMLLCAAATRLPDGTIVHLQRGSPRLVRSLYEERFQLTALTLVVMVVGVLLALWLGRRMVGPLEQLRDQVVARTRGPVSTEPVPVETDDEIGELARAFNQLLAALEARNQSNAAFAADLAHELKNPVAAVRAASEALASDRPLEGARRERLQRVLGDSSRRMEAVVDRFLDLARAEAGLPGAARERVDLRALVDGLVAPLRVDERFGGVRFEVEGGEVAVLAVPERLETALRNLLSNAAAFSAPDGRVAVHVGAVGGRAHVVVEDTGPGVPPDDLPRIFDRYYTTREGGTGLGLPLTRAIVEAHGGTLEVASTPGEGACFTLRLPAA